MGVITFNILELYYELYLKLFKIISTNLISKTKIRLLVIAPGRELYTDRQTDFDIRAFHVLFYEGFSVISDNGLSFRTPINKVDGADMIRVNLCLINILARLNSEKSKFDYALKDH